VSDYIPYDERIHRQRAAEKASSARAEQLRRNEVQEVRDLLMQLDGRDTNAFLEVLKPRRGLTWLRNPFATVVVLPGKHDGPNFVIAEIAPAYRIRGALQFSMPEGGRTYDDDAYVTVNGRVWRFLGEPEPNNTLQVLASSVMTLDDVHLGKIAVALRALTL
jgi:hypothetical protein